MKDVDYGSLLYKVIVALKNSAEALKNIDSKKEGFNKERFDGMAFAYHRVLDCVKSTMKFEEEIDLSEFDLEKYNPNDILFYKPKS